VNGKLPQAGWALAALSLVAGCGGGDDRPEPVAARSFEDPGFVRSGEFEMRYGLLLADELNPAVAKAYGIDRRPDRVVVNVSILDSSPGSTPQPVEADVRGTYRTLTREPRPLEFRRVVEQESVSYLAEFGFRNREAVVIEFESLPPGGGPALRAKLTRTFETR
jgi:hypothetical protein